MTRITIFIAVAALLVVAPFLVGTLYHSIITKMLIAAIFACGYNLLMGQAGLLAFGHAAFYGFGAIATLHLMMAIERAAISIPTPLVPLAGALAGFVSAAIAGYFATKRTGAYFALVTFAIAELVHVVAPMWQSVFGGEAGITAMRSPWLAITFGSDIEVYYLVLVWALVSIGGLWLLTGTAFGRLTLAIRENDHRLRFLGFDAHFLKVCAFAVSGAVTGLAGALFAMTNEAANYTLFAPDVSAQVIFHAFIGGTSTFFGPAIAAAILTFLPYWLSDLTRAWPLYQGLLFMAIMLFMPRGIGGWVQDRYRAYANAPSKRSGLTERGAPSAAQL